jgi:hypothetical protein
MALQPPFPFLHLQLRGKIQQTTLEVDYENSKSAHLHYLVLPEKCHFGAAYALS